jgi:hypothetical protein
MMACRNSPLPSFAPGITSWAFQPGKQASRLLVLLLLLLLLLLPLVPSVHYVDIVVWNFPPTLVWHCPRDPFLLKESTE